MIYAACPTSTAMMRAFRSSAKRQKTYRPWVEGALQAGAEGAATQDEIVAEQFVWALDYADYGYALEIAAHMITNGVAMPERFPSASVASFTANKVAEDSLRVGSDVPLSVLQSVSALTADHDMHDEKRAKLMKALSRAYAKAAEEFDAGADNAVAGGKPALVNAALIHAERALQLNKTAGVKKDIEKLNRLLADLGGPPPVQDEQETAAEDEGDGTGQANE